jgi:hypothetical protein
MSRQIYQVILNFVEIGAMKAILRLGSPMDFFCLCFRHLLSDLGEIWYMKSAHNAECLEDRHREGLTFLVGENAHIFRFVA